MIMVLSTNFIFLFLSLWMVILSAFDTTAGIEEGAFNINKFHMDLKKNFSETIKSNDYELFKNQLAILASSGTLLSNSNCSIVSELRVLFNIASLFWLNDKVYESLVIVNTLNENLRLLLTEMSEDIQIECHSVIIDSALSLSMLLAEIGDWNQGFKLLSLAKSVCSYSRNHININLIPEFSIACRRSIAQTVLFQISDLSSFLIDGEHVASGLLNPLDINTISGSDFAPFESHNVFWLVASELQYLIKYHGIKNIARYFKELQMVNSLVFCGGSNKSNCSPFRGSSYPLSFCSKKSDISKAKDCSIYYNDSGTSDLNDNIDNKIFHRLWISLDFPARGISKANYLVAFIKHLKEMHSRLSVFFDEYGAFSKSQSHHTASLFLSYSSVNYDILNNVLSQNCSIESSLLSVPKGEYVDSIAKIIATTCLFPRGVLATPPIFSDDYEFLRYRQQQLQDVQCVSSVLAGASKLNLSREMLQVTSKMITEEESFEERVTSTPPSMMIGYDTISDGRMGGPELSSMHLLKAANDASKYCTSIKFWEESVIPFINDFQLIKSRVSSVSSSDSRIRVAFISSFLFDHSVGRLIAPTMLSLNKSIFIVSAVCVGCDEYTPNTDYPDKIADDLHRNCERWIDLSLKTKSSWVNSLQSESFDIIIYPELGMDKGTVMLAHFRLAALQLVYWGHPISQFQDSIDYYLSSDLFEVNATKSDMILQRQEQVVLFEGLSTSFLKPALLRDSTLEPQTIDDNVVLEDNFDSGLEDECSSLESSGNERQSDCNWLIEHGISVHGPIILLPHTIMKYSIGFDSVILSILYGKENNSVCTDKSTIVILYKASQRLWYERLRSRLHLKLLQQALSRHCDIDSNGIDKLSSSSRNIDYIYRDLQVLKCNRTHLNESIDTDGLQINRDINDMFFKRLIFIPKLSQQEFYRLIKLSTVVLDPFPFGMGVTALEAFSMGTPVVTLPSRQTVPALVHGFLKKMEMNQFVARTVDDYITIVNTLIAYSGSPQSLEFKNKIRNIASTELFQSNQYQNANEWNNVLSKLFQYSKKI